MNREASFKQCGRTTAPIGFAMTIAMAFAFAAGAHALDAITGKDARFRRTANAVATINAPTIDGKLDDAVWRSAPRYHLRHRMTGAAVEYATDFQVVRDRHKLFLAIVGHEQSADTIATKAPQRDDVDIFKGDNVEILLAPSRRPRPSYQIVVSPSGGIWDARWLTEGAKEPWDGRHIQIAGSTSDAQWTIEVAIPFKDLGVAAPKDGDVWRLNVCRADRSPKQLSSWAVTGGRFNIPDTFGYLTFDAPSADEGEHWGEATLSGKVVDNAGEPRGGVHVKTRDVCAQSDASGEYQLTKLPEGATRVYFEHPKYDPTAVDVNVVSASDKLPTISLAPFDPFAPDYAGPIGDGPVAWLRSSIVEPPDMTRKPTKKDFADSLPLSATPGEFESVAIAFFANANLESPSATLTALRGPGADIPTDRLEVRWVDRALRRLHLRQAIESAKWVWRYLWREAPERVAAGRLRMLVVTAHVPDAAPAGVYRGELRLSSGGRPVASLPVELRVAGFQLAQPEKRVGCYYRSYLGKHYLKDAQPKSDEQLARELTDIHEHGGRALMWTERVLYDEKDGKAPRDFEGIRKSVRLQKKFGFAPPYMVGPRPRELLGPAGYKGKWSERHVFMEDNERFRELLVETMKELERLQEKIAPGQFAYTWGDEIINRKKYLPWIPCAKIIREVTDTPVYITVHNRKPAILDLVMPYIDIVCYHGRSLDEWIADGHSWEELKADLDKHDATGWTYYNFVWFSEDAEYSRVCNGYWLWRSCLQVHAPWIYHYWGGGPFDNMDSAAADYGFAFPHPTKPELVGTLRWECFREGYDDLRYLTTLDRAIAKAEAVRPKHKAVRSAKALRRSYWEADSRAAALAANLTAGDYRRRREDMTRAIEALMAVK